jgi:geranylgeranyl pyrophosphate synthase
MKGIAVRGFERVLDELAGVEDVLGEALGSSVPFIDNLGRFLHQAKGKRLRPALAILFYKLLGEQGEREELLRLSAVLELIHLATLVHDDVIDQSDTRRNQPTLHVVNTNQIAVLEGDYLFMQMFKRLNEFPKPTRDFVIATVSEVLEGELLQESLRGVVPTESQYWDVVAGKTASLIACACVVGTQWGKPDLSDSEQQTVYDAGMLMGRAFQLVDDLLDVFGDEAEVGKPLWNDIKGGWLSLPMIRLVGRKPDFAPILIDIEQSESRKDEIQSALLELDLHQTLNTEADTMLNQAVEQLSWLPESELRTTLFDTINFIAKRRK